MAHIVSCMLEGEPEAGTSNLYISKPSSPPPSDDQTSSDRPGEKPYVWRMHQPERKYQLFPPKDKQPAPAPSKGLDPEQAFALAMGQNGEKTDKPSTSGGLRLRIKEHTLIRRRKVSVPDLGPMTTVQEVAMDSPTIPGRPPLHERSISAPGHSWRYQPFPDAPVSRPSVHDELDEIISEAVACTVDRSSAKQPLSPKSLAPLVIPPHVSAAPRLAHQSSLGRLRSTSSSTDPLRSARPDDSPKTKTPFTPLSANTAMTTPRSAMTTSTLPTPLSAPVEARSSPKPWPETDVALLSTPKKDSSPDPNATPKAEVESRSAAPMLGHRRGQSENSTMGIMERGRPRKRVDNGETVAVRAASKRSKSAERRAFESLPKGWKASEASTVLTQNEVSSIQRQALQQAARFEVLRREDVDNLSKELRHLDERTEYLRRTYTSLRAGRRNLHSRICQYLRSPRVAKFSHESMLKQEESLAELDASIDDWVTKLDHAENRRTRVRQKLLEHVAAAAMLASPGIVGASESLQYAMGVKATQLPNGTGNIATPPRSPTKLTFLSSTGSPSPQRVGAHVPSTIFEQPLFEDAATVDLAPVPPTAATRNSIAASRVDVESIRIYAGDELYTLLTDVENEISRMGEASSLPAAADSPNLTDEERKHLHRAHSQELLNGGALAKKCSPPPSPERSPVRKNSVGEVLLTNAVFRPERSVLAL